jgi:hypothetical protein
MPAVPSILQGLLRLTCCWAATRYQVPGVGTMGMWHGMWHGGMGMACHRGLEMGSVRITTIRAARDGKEFGSRSAPCRRRNGATH